MATPNVQGLGARAWALARRDQNVVTHAELLGLGYSPMAIKHRVKTGRLHPKSRGVYAVGSPNLTRYGWWMVAIKTCGPRAVLSHLSAAVLWSIWKGRASQVIITVPPDTNPRPREVKVFRRLLTARDVTRQHGIPVTTPSQTLIDCATAWERAQVEQLVNEADARNLLRAARCARSSTTARASAAFGCSATSWTATSSS
jgi:predicted transcriptional regulator of viral defense system